MNAHQRGCRCHSVLRDLLTEMLHYQQGSTETIRRRYIAENAARGSMGKITIALPWKLAQRIIDTGQHPDFCQDADKHILDDRDLPEGLRRGEHQRS